MNIYDVYNDALANATKQIVELYHEFLKSEGREDTQLNRLDFWDDNYSRIVDVITFNTRVGTVRRAIIAALISNVDDVFEDGSLPVFGVGMISYDGNSAFDLFKIICNLKFNEMLDKRFNT